MEWQSAQLISCWDESIGHHYLPSSPYPSLTLTPLLGHLGTNWERTEIPKVKCADFPSVSYDQKKSWLF